MYYALNLDCNKSKTDGDFEGYSYDSNSQINTTTNPKGQVWWQSNDGSTNWSPVLGTDPKKQGDPKHVSPVVVNGDTVWVAIRDVNNPISAVTLAIVFGKRAATPGQAPIASPFQNSAAGAITYVQTTFTATNIILQTPANSGWYQIPFPTKVSYPGGGSGHVSFGYYFGASVNYSDGTVRQFGVDPEMDVSDYSGGSK
jgi:hypothetical protein